MLAAVTHHSLLKMKLRWRTDGDVTSVAFCAGAAARLCHCRCEWRRDAAAFAGRNRCRTARGLQLRGNGRLASHRARAGVRHCVSAHAWSGGTRSGRGIGGAIPQRSPHRLGMEEVLRCGQPTHTCRVFSATNGALRLPPHRARPTASGSGRPTLRRANAGEWHSVPAPIFSGVRPVRRFCDKTGSILPIFSG